MDIFTAPTESRVLLVEDDLGVAQVQLVALRLAGIAVDWVSTVAEGRIALDTSGYTLCIVDHHLPDGLGSDLISHVRELLASDMPVIVVSGARQGPHVVRAYTLGATEYITKPFSPATLTDAVRRLL